MNESKLRVFNGIDGSTGKYFQPPMTVRDLAALARQEPRYSLPKETPKQVRKGLGDDVDPRELSQTGWGVVFTESADPAVVKALTPLLELRREQAGRVRAARYRETTYRAGESKTDFLRRHGVAPGVAQPEALPYYLLLVGDPEEIPFELQYQLDVQHAVGRIHFPTADDYARYAESVAHHESGAARNEAVASFFGPRNVGDAATAMSCEQLALPLAAGAAARFPRWTVEQRLGEAATKEGLRALLSGDRPPAFLFTAGHGVCFPAGDPRQERLQGALVCQDWPGPDHLIETSQYFSRDDVSDDARVAGLVAFHFSCYGAGTPRLDGFPVPVHGERQIAGRAFLSGLSRRLLTHPGGSALAVVGHIDRAWGWSYSGASGTTPRLRPVFENTLRRLLGGFPVGYAMEFFNSCYAELASDLDDEIRSERPDRDELLAELWTNRNDARNYAVLGDPAVRLAVAPEAFLAS